MDMRKLRESNRNRQMAARLARRGMNGGMGDVVPGNATQGAQGLTQKFDQGILTGFRPGNIGDINQALWPFWFQFTAHNLAPGLAISESFSVTQEAAYLVRQISASTFLKDPITGAYEYIDPYFFDESANSPNNLLFTMEDAQSSRQYNGRTSEPIAMLGNANFPTIYPSTLFMLPNQTMLMNLQNIEPPSGNTYRCFITVMGYRCRVADAQKILSLVSG